MSRHASVPALVWLGRDPPLVLGAEGRPLAAAELARLRARGEGVTVLLPGERVLPLSLPPLRARGEAFRQAVRYAAEDALAEPVEAVHVVPVGETTAGIEALCVAHAAMREALDRIAALGLRAERLSVDALLLPWEGRPVAVRVGERILARIGPGRGFAVEAALWPSVGGRLGIDLRPESWDGMEAFLAAALRRGLPELPELLTPPYAVRSGGIAAGLARVAALALLCLLLALAHRAGELAAFRRAHEALRAEAAELYSALRAVDGPVPDPLPMLEAALTAADGRGGGALPLLRRLAPVVAGGPSQRLEGLEYREGVLELELRMPDLASLDLLRERLATLPGVTVELVSAQPGAEGAEGRLRLREGG